MDGVSDAVAGQMDSAVGASQSPQDAQLQAGQPQLHTDKTDESGLATSAVGALSSSELTVDEAPAPAADVSAQPLEIADGPDEGVDMEEHVAKRPRLDARVLGHDEPLDDEAVLALAAHNGATGADQYPEE